MEKNNEVDAYKTIILDAIEQVKKAHDVKDPYWARTIADLVSDFNEFATQSNHKDNNNDTIVMNVVDILKEFFKEEDEDIN
jgi:hypothetical protein